MDLSGFDEWNQTLNRLVEVGRSDELEDVVYVGGLIAETEMKLLAQQMKIHDTGATWNSIYTRTASHSTYSQNASAARSRQPGVELNLENKPANQAEYAEARIGPSTEYAVDIEYGNSRVAARPFVRNTLPRAKNKIVDGMTAVTKAKIEERI